MYKDYEYWYKENESLFEHFKHHNSIILNRYQDIFDVLNFIKGMDEKELDDDYELIFSEGFAYIYDRINYIKSFLNNNFIGDLHLFLKYEELIGYYLYLEDIMEAYDREEKDISLIKPTFEEIQEEIMDVINTRKSFDNSLIDKFERKVNLCVYSNSGIVTTPEVFSRINEEIYIKKGQEGIE